MIQLKDINIRLGRKEIINSGNMTMYPGVLTGLIGESGSGKSTLFNIISLFKYENQFPYIIDNIDLSSLSSEDKKLFIRNHIAYLQQDSCLLEYLNCKEHILYEANICGNFLDDSKIEEILKQVNLIESKNKYPSQLSGGEKQRLAIAMALAKNANIFICDEITSSLDEENTITILELLKSLAKNGNYVILSSHEHDIIDQCDTIYKIEDHRIELLKQTNTTSNLEFNIQDKKIKSSIFSQLAIKRIKNNKIRSLLFIVLISITIISLLITQYSGYQAKQSLKKTLNTLNSNELNIKYALGSYDAGFYDFASEPIEQEDINKIKDISGVENVYSIYSGTILNHKMQPMVNHFEIKKNGEVIRTIEVKPNITWIFGNVDHIDYVFPYIPENDLSLFCSKKTNNTNGIYFDEAMLLGLDLADLQLEDGMSMAFDFYVPVGQKPDYATTYYDNGETESVTMSYSNYVIKRIELPLSGMIKPGYSDPVIQSQQIFIPYDYFWDCILEAEKEYTLGPNEHEVKPTYLKVIFNDIESKINGIDKIKEISDKFITIDTYANYKEMLETEFNSNVLIYLYGYLMLVISLIAVGVYSSIYRKEILNDEHFFNLRGFTSKEKRQISIEEIKYVSKVTIIASIVLFNLSIYVDNRFLRLMNLKIFSVEYFILIGIAIILSILFSLLSEIRIIIGDYHD